MTLENFMRLANELQFERRVLGEIEYRILRNELINKFIGHTE